VHVVDPLEVVDVEHEDGHRAMSAARFLQRVQEPLVECAVVEEAGQRVGLRLVLEPRADLRIVERERSGVRETLRQLELRLAEHALLAEAVDVEHALDLRTGDERNRDERLGVDRRPRHDADPRIEVRLVDENGLSVAGRPAGHALVETDARPHDLVRVLVADDHRDEQALRLVGLVDGEVVVRNEVGERVGDAHEERVEALLGEHLVEHVGEPPVRLDDRRLRRHTELLRQQPEVLLGAPYHAPPIDLRCTCSRIKLLALEADTSSIAAVRAVPIPHPREQVTNRPDGTSGRHGRFRRRCSDRTWLSPSSTVPCFLREDKEGGDRVAAARKRRSVRGSASAPPGTC